MSAYLSGSIAGVALQSSGVDCRCHLLDSGNLRPNHTGTTRWSASAVPFTQVLSTTKGQTFGIKADYLPSSVLTSVINAINSAMNGGAGSFNVTVANEIDSYNISVIPDYSTAWVTYPEQRTDTRAVKDVVFRFVRV